MPIHGDLDMIADLDWSQSDVRAIAILFVTSKKTSKWNLTCRIAQSASQVWEVTQVNHMRVAISLPLREAPEDFPTRLLLATVLEAELGLSEIEAKAVAQGAATAVVRVVTKENFEAVRQRLLHALAGWGLAITLRQPARPLAVVPV